MSSSSISTAVRARKPRRVASTSSPVESKPPRPPVHPRPASDRGPVPRLADLGVHGFEQYEVAIYAALVTDVNINTASQEDLETIPGIGPTRASQIIAGRPYARVEDLERLSGIGLSQVEGMKRFTTIDGPTTRGVEEE
jgi:competence protein ComEA